MSRGLCVAVLAVVLTLTARAQDTVFVAMAVPDAVWQRMQGRSYPAGCPVGRDELRYLRLSHVDAEGRTHTGEMVCHRSLAADLVHIFRQLWLAGYPIERMRLIDDYEADDQKSMAANNTSCFCWRAVSGTGTLSRHARGMAVDVNPLYNPYIYTRGGARRVEPKEGERYADRNLPSAYMIRRGDLLHRLMLERGFRWGGAWTRSKDYQHFERENE